jgi:hypothetical protein
MGANSTQAQGVALFLIAFAVLAAGFAAAYNFILILIGLVILAASVVLFTKCKPWEHADE